MKIANKISIIHSRIFILAFSSWLSVPLAVLFAEFNHFHDSPQVLIYLYATNIQLPFLLLLNDVLAPTFTLRRVRSVQQFILITVTVVCLFLSMYASLLSIKFVSLSYLEVLFMSFASVAGCLLSFFGVLFIYRKISQEKVSYLDNAGVFVAGMTPGAVVLIIFFSTR